MLFISLLSLLLTLLLFLVSSPHNPERGTFAKDVGDKEAQAYQQDWLCVQQHTGAASQRYPSLWLPLHIFIITLLQAPPVYFQRLFRTKGAEGYYFSLSCRKISGFPDFRHMNSQLYFFLKSILARSMTDLPVLEGILFATTLAFVHFVLFRANKG